MNRQQRRAMDRLAKRPRAPERRAAADQEIALALEQHREGKIDQAIAGYQRVLSVDPNNIDARMNLGRAYATLGKQAEALEHFRFAQKIAPNQPALQQDFAVALIEFGLWDDALQMLTRALAREPGNPRALANLGHALNEIGRRDEAAAALRRAIELDPLFGSAYFELYRAVYDDRNLAPAVDALTRAVLNAPEDVWSRFCFAVTLDQQGSAAAAATHFERLHQDKSVFRGAVDSWDYVKSKRTPATRFFTTTREMILFGLDAARIEGLVIELGVRYGISTRWIADRAAGKVHGFDSFEGLPEAWHIQPKGAYSTHGALPAVPPNVELHVGWFDETLPRFLARAEGPIRFMNVDCDLYSSTLSALEILGDRIVPGTVIVFDEYLLNDEWRNDEFKAFQEVVERRRLRYEYLAFSMCTGQAVIRMT